MTLEKRGVTQFSATGAGPWSAFELSRTGPFRTPNPETFLDFSLQLSVERFHKTNLPASPDVLPRQLGFFAGDDAPSPSNPAAVSGAGRIWRVRGRMPGPGLWRWRLELVRGVDSALAALGGAAAAGEGSATETGPRVDMLDQGVIEIAGDAADGEAAAQAPSGGGPLRLVDDRLVGADDNPVALRGVVDLAQRAALAPGGDLSASGLSPSGLSPSGLSQGDLALIDPLAAGVVWSEGRLFALDPAAIDRAAAMAMAAARLGAVIGVSLGSVAVAAAAGLTRAERARSTDVLIQRAETLLTREIVTRFGAIDPLVWIAPEEGRLGALATAADGLGRPVLSALPAISGRAPATDDAAGPAVLREAPPRRPVSPPASAVLSARAKGDAEAREKGHEQEAAVSPPPPDAVRPVRRWLGDGQIGEESAARTLRMSARPADRRQTGPGDMPGAEAASAPDGEGAPPAAAPTESGAEPARGRSRSRRISLSSFWPRPGRTAGSDEPPARRDAPEAVARTAAAPTGADAPIRIRSGEPEARMTTALRTEGAAALELALYSMGAEALETARRLDVEAGLPLGRVVDDGLRLAARISGDDVEQARSVRMTALDAERRVVSDAEEPFEGMALFQPLAPEAAVARTVVFEAMGQGAAPLKRWVIDCAAAPRAAAAPARKPEPAEQERPAGANRDALRLNRVDFTDPETDRLISVWRPGDAGPGPLPAQTTLTVSIAGTGAERSRRAVATLAFRNASDIRVEATPIVDDRGALCVFYDLALEGVADALTLELFDAPDATAPFARLAR